MPNISDDENRLLVKLFVPLEDIPENKLPTNRAFDEIVSAIWSLLWLLCSNLPVRTFCKNVFYSYFYFSILYRLRPYYCCELLIFFNNYYSQRISNIISGSSCLHVRGRCNISAVHFFVILHKPHLVYHIFSVIFTIFFYFVHILFIYNCYNNICLKENFS